MEQSDDGSWRVPCLPKTGVVATNPSERALARLFNMRLNTEPEGEAMQDLAGDSFMTCWKATPHTVESCPPSRAVNKTLLDWTLSKAEFAQARASTANNLPAALATSGLLWQSLTTEDALKGALEKQKEAEEKEKEAREEYEHMKDRLEHGDQQGADEAQKAAEQAMKDAQDAADMGIAAVEKLKGSPLGQGMMASACKKAGEDGQKVAATMAGWGIDPDEVTASDVEEIIEISQSDIARISQLIGRFSGISSRAIERTVRGYTGVVAEPAMTKDIEKLFPLERAYISNQAPPLLRKQKLHQLLEGGGLLGWQPKFSGKKSGGAIFITDKSYSMIGYPFMVAKGISLGMAKALKSTSTCDRIYTCHFFDAGDPEDLPSVTSFQDWRAHLAWAKTEVGGGTVFDNAINFAIKKAREMKAQGVSGIDIVMTTDEQSSLSKQTIAAFKQLQNEIGTRLFVVSIGGRENKYLRDIADFVVYIDNASDLDGVADKVVDKFTTAIIKNDLK